MEDFSTGALIAIILYFIWVIIYVVQGFLAYGTAYRKTKANGDNGVALFGWFFVYGLAALIPYLGIHLWKKSKREDFK
ncbi:hypothetical protein [Floricoccus penangensis]|uniref:hypothetical protein n=1 Tax=Floricoccus penangensis TaxID=1859475 RepID=UPI002041782B|nr:hypothetical protein [Floricoccus penangensis]URZ86973.1 hypothetical protein KIW23_07770 [Floricoccus penangensis]